MRFFKMFSGEETSRQKRIHRAFRNGFTMFFLKLMKVTRFDKVMAWQESTSRRNQMIIFIIMGLLIVTVIITPFLRKAPPVDNSIVENQAFIESMNAKKQIYASPNPRVVRLAQLLDSLKIDRERLEYDTAYLNRVSNFIIRKMYREHLMTDTTSITKPKN